jgi:hypothetical protein
MGLFVYRSRIIENEIVKWEGCSELLYVKWLLPFEKRIQVPT